MKKRNFLTVAIMVALGLTALDIYRTLCGVYFANHNHAVTALVLDALILCIFRDEWVSRKEGQ